MKRTPLYEAHYVLGGKIIDFGGWELPVQYSGIIEEHETVRNAAGLFDVSHMGEIIVQGRDAEEFIEGLITNKITGVKEHKVVYSPMCYHDGGVVDDLLVYKYNNENYLIVVNASNTEKDFDWIKSNLKGNVTILNASEQYAQLALQGPKAEEILQKLVSIPLKDLKFFFFADEVEICGVKSIISRTGYTGEDGFEIYLPSEHAQTVWNKILEVGKEDGIQPIGLGARDTLRFEAVLPLYGQEISQHISPLEAGLDIFVKLDKGAFIGREALIKQKEQGVKRKLAGFEMIDRGIARSHYEVQHEGVNIGSVTTGSFSPTLKKNLGLALVNSEYSDEGTEFEILVRNKGIKAKVIKIPFYEKRYKK